MNLKKSNVLQDSKDGIVKDSIVKKFINLDSKNKSTTETTPSSPKNYFEKSGLDQCIFTFVLNAESQIQGLLNIQGPALIEGQVIGDITCNDTLIIGENASITGNIKGLIIAVFGNVNGDIIADEKLLLCSNSSENSTSIVGNICGKSIMIQEGVAFEGACRMGGLN